MIRTDLGSASSQNIGAGFINVATITAPSSGTHESRLIIKLTGLNVAHTIQVKETQNAVVYLNRAVSSGETSALIEVSVKLATGDNSYVIAIKDTSTLSTTASWSYEVYQLSDAVETNIAQQVALTMYPSKGALFVSKQGNNSNDGLSWNTAKLTIANAVLGADAGDVIFVGPGTFNEQVSTNSDIDFIGSGYGNAGTIIVSATSPAMKTAIGGRIKGFEVQCTTGDAEGTTGINAGWVEDCKAVVTNSGVGTAIAYQGLDNNDYVRSCILSATTAATTSGRIFDSFLIGTVAGSANLFNCPPTSGSVTSLDTTLDSILSLLQSR